MKGRINLVAAAFALTALSYGLGRFAYGLLLPHIREDLSLSATGAGWIGGSAFAAYCFGIVLAFVAGARLGERRVAVLASLTATSGLALVAVASSGWSLGLAIALAGLSTGLTSPPLASAVARCVEEAARPKANGAINAGTAAGIILSGFAVTAFPGGWRELYALFAVVGAGVTVWLWFAMPAVSGERASGGLPLECLKRPGVGGLCASAFLMGAASTAIWTFGADIMRGDLGFADGRIALAWSVLGAAGILGAGTGLLTLRFGIGPVHRFALFAMAVALIGLAAATLRSDDGLRRDGTVRRGLYRIERRFPAVGDRAVFRSPRFRSGSPFPDGSARADGGRAAVRDRMGCGGERDGASFLRRDHGKCRILAPGLGALRKKLIAKNGKYVELCGSDGMKIAPDKTNRNAICLAKEGQRPAVSHRAQPPRPGREPWKTHDRSKTMIRGILCAAALAAALVNTTPARSADDKAAQEKAAHEKAR